MKLSGVAELRTTGDAAKGRGLFASRLIRQGMVLSLEDEQFQLIPVAKLEGLPAREAALCNDYEFDDRYAVCPGDFSSPSLSFFFNHDCNRICQRFCHFIHIVE